MVWAAGWVVGNTRVLAGSTGVRCRMTASPSLVTIAPFYET
jgi:hypothetical protein